MHTRDDKTNAVVVYNQAAIKSWTDEVNTVIPLRKRAAELSGENYRKRLHRINKKIEILHDNIRAKRHQIALLDAQVALLEKAQEESADPAKNKEKKAYQQLNALSTLSQLRTSILDLEQDQSRFQGKIKLLEQEERGYKATYQQIEMEISQLDSHERLCRRHCAQAQTFLDKLQNNPVMLVDELSQSIFDLFRKYDLTHPRHQSMTVRKILAELPIKFKTIYDSQANAESKEPSVSNSKEREKYFLLCGLAYDLYRRLNVDYSENQLLIEKFQSILSLIHLSESGDLPDHFNRGRSCQMNFASFRENSRRMIYLSDTDLATIENEDYENARHQLNVVLSGFYATPHDEAEKILTWIDKVSHKPESKADLKFHTTILTKTKELISNPKNTICDYEAYEFLSGLADHAPCRPKKTAGLALSIAGTAGGLFTYGAVKLKSTTPICSNQTLGIVGITSMAALTTGICLFKSGKRQSLSRDMMELVRAMKSAKLSFVGKSRQRIGAAFD